MDYSFLELDTIPIVENNTTEDSNQMDSSSDGKTNNKANKLYNNLGYLSSTDHFLKMEKKKGELSSKEKEQLANSYRLNSMTHDAEYWYAQIINDDPSAENIMYYAEMLQSNGKCEDAVRWFQVYTDRSGDKNRSFIEDCNGLQSIDDLQGVTIENMEDINTAALDFSPIPYEDGIVFSSTRQIAKSTLNTDKWTKEKFSDLFYAEKKEGNFSNPKPINELNNRFHDGTATFNHPGDYVIFTRNSKKGKSSEGIRELKLFEANLEKGSWTNIKALNLNDNEFATCHPTLSLDGHRLYFSSNRPGGYGGMDIYVSHKISGTWKEPINLGPIVNSSGNEVFPYIYEDEKLYFSSNGHIGVGGLDIFVAEKTDLADETSWNTRKNIGKPFNSPKDDIGFCIEQNNQSGYLTSNRKGGLGKDDIYYWTMDEDAIAKTQKKASQKTFCVYNIVNQERIEGVSVTILSGDFKSGDQELRLALRPSTTHPDEYIVRLKKANESSIPNAMTYTDENGNFQYTLGTSQDYYFVLSKKGFGTIQHQTDLQMFQKQDEYCIAMAPRLCMNMKGTIINENYKHPVPFANVELFNRCTGEKIITRANENGQFEFCVDCECEFEIIVNKERFQERMIVFSTIGKNCEKDTSENVTINMKVMNREDWQNTSIHQNQLSSSNRPNQPQQHPFDNNSSDHHYGNDPTSSNNKNSEPSHSKEYLIEYFTGNPDTKITEGQTFILKDIYYDFDRHDIRPDASIELNYIAKLMTMQPSMEISLKAHTDSRGKEYYNQELSQKRAEAAKNYLISRGISPQRIGGATGFGESQPAIPCFNNDCTEKDHQINRRTEITILKI